MLGKVAWLGVWKAERVLGLVERHTFDMSVVIYELDVDRECF